MMYAAFFELLDQLYWKEYAENLQKEGPKAFDLPTDSF
ncbi:hypothetical protein QFZ20_002194 [Flavobacterium sp. W4I14]|nr:hypothetical protein [Flavobacterium sp. W4I14]